MKKNITLAALALTINAFAQSPQFDQALFYKGSNSSYILDMSSDQDGNTYAGGYFYGTLTLGQDVLPEPQSFHEQGFVCKVSQAGDVLWTRLLGGKTRVYAVEKDGTGNLYVAGFFRETLILNGTTYNAIGVNDIFVAKLNAQGNTVWFRQMGGSADESNYYACSVNDMVADAAGNLYFTGFFTDSLSFQSQRLTALGRNDVVTGKLNAAGDLQWWQRAGGNYGGDCGLPNNDNGAGIALDKAGNVLIAGHYAFNFHIGDTIIYANHNVDMYLAKYDNNGNYLWALSEGGLSWEMATSVACDNNNNVYMTGHFKETCIIGTETFTSVSISGSQYDVFISKYNSDGDFLWARQEGGNRSEYAVRIVTDYADNFYIAGTFDGDTYMADTVLSGLPNRCFIARYTSDGVPVYITHGGGAGNNPQALCMDRNNDLMLGGFATAHPNTPLQFGNISVTPTGNYIFIARLKDPFNSPFSQEEAAMEAQVLVFPNPMDQELIFRFSQAQQQACSLQMFDMQGRMVHSQAGITGSSFTMQRGSLAAGAYVYRIHIPGQEAATGRILVR